jgi:hypothetical protein
MPEIFRLALCVYICEYCPKSTKSHHNQHDDYISLFFFIIYPGQTQKKITWNMPSKEYHPTESQLKEVTVAMTLKHKNIRHLEKSHDMTPLTTIHL